MQQAKVNPPSHTSRRRLPFPLMPKRKSAGRASHSPAKSADKTAATSAQSAQVDFLILSIMSAVVPMIEAKCGTMNMRDQNTLERHVETAVRQFVGKR